ncbi:6-bladed beta-propeller [Bacteroides sp. OttesenSCG-928-D19]|nr:6-bladed beta-propeller [Bacteroides sp. OttesenSCG-928-D19]
MFLFLFLACNSAERESSIPVINPKTAMRQEIRLSAIADEVTYIRFDTTKIFSGFSSFLFADSLVFINTSNYGVLKYNSEGTFLKQIGGIGQGPSEYNVHTRSAIDLENRQLFVYDEPGIILTFSFDGELISRTKTECTEKMELFMPFGFNYHQGCFYLFYLIHPNPGCENYCWVVLDKEGKIISSKIFEHHIPFDNPGAGTRPQLFNYQFHQSPLYWNQYNDTIFRFSNGKPEAAYLWADGDFRLTPTHVNNRSTTECLIPLSIVDTKNYLFILYSMGHGQRVLLLDKQKNTWIDSDKYLIDDINGGVVRILYSYIQIAGEEYILSVSHASKLKEALMESATPRSMALAETIDEEDNNVIVAIRLKKQTFPQ